MNHRTVSTTERPAQKYAEVIVFIMVKGTVPVENNAGEVSAKVVSQMLRMIRRKTHDRNDSAIRIDTSSQGSIVKAAVEVSLTSPNKSIQVL